MPKEKDRMDLTQHQQIGDTLRSLDAQIKRLQSEVQAVYSEEAGRPFKQMLEGLNELRCFLDSRVFIENPDRDGNANASIYFDGGRRGCGRQSAAGIHGCKGCDHHQDHSGTIIPLTKKDQSE